MQDGSQVNREHAKPESPGGAGRVRTCIVPHHTARGERGTVGRMHCLLCYCSIKPCHIRESDGPFGPEGGIIQWVI